MRLHNAVFAVSFALSGAAANAATVVDTGPASASGIRWALGPGQDLAGLFTLGSATKVTSVKGFIDSSETSTGTIRIYSASALPDISKLLFSRSFTISATPHGGLWQGVSGENWDLAAGNYWVSFSSNSGVGMYGNVPSPLSDYAFTSSGDWFQFSGFNVGVQIESGTSAVPEPSTWVMLLLGFFSIGYAMRSGKARQRLALSYS